MHFYRVLPLAAVAGLLTACSGDDSSTFVTPDPAAAVRWINAVPDTMPLDFRFVDVASNASQDNLAYKGISGNWRRVPPATQHIEAFQTGQVSVGGLPAGDVSIVSKVIVDGSATVADGHKYTVLATGFTKTGASPRAQFKIFEDVLPTVAATSVAFRIINTDPNTSIDVYAVAASTAPSGVATGTPVATGVAYATPTTWISLPVTTAPQVYYFRVTAAGSTTVISTVAAPAGIPSQAQTATTAAIDAVAGSQIGASALTMVYFPAGSSYTVTNPAVVGATGTQTFAAPTAGIGFVADVNPARVSP